MVNPAKINWSIQVQLTLFIFNGEKRKSSFSVLKAGIIVDSDVLQEKFTKRYKEVSTVTVGIAGLSTKLEAAVLPEGVLSGVATVLLNPQRDICPYALTAIFNTKLYSDLYKGLFGMSGMTADVLNYSARQLAQYCHCRAVSFYSHSQEISTKFQEIETIFDRWVLSALGQYGHRHWMDLIDKQQFQGLLERSLDTALSRSLKTDT